MKFDTLFCIWTLVNTIGIIEVTTPRKWIFWFYISSLYYYWFPSTWKSLAHNSWGEMERCEKRSFQLLKMRKKKISWNIKNKGVTGFYWQRGLRVWRIILVITGWAYQRQKCTIISIKMRIFFLHVTGYLNRKNSFPICMFLVMASGKCELHTYLTFLQEF